MLFIFLSQIEQKISFIRAPSLISKKTMVEFCQSYKTAVIFY